MVDEAIPCKERVIRNQRPVFHPIAAGWLVLFVFIIIGGAAVEVVAGGPPVPMENSADNLKNYFNVLREAIVDGDADKAAALTGALFPDEKRLKAALKDDASPEVMATILNSHRQFRKSIPLEKLFATDPARSEILVHGASTEDIARNAPGTIVYKEFPGGAVTLARTVLRPGVVFYEVELVEPGESRGMKYHLFYWDGNGWSILGPMWRVLK